MVFGTDFLPYYSLSPSYQLQERSATQHGEALDKHLVFGYFVDCESNEQIYQSEQTKVFITPKERKKVLNEYNFFKSITNVINIENNKF